MKKQVLAPLLRASFETSATRGVIPIRVRSSQEHTNPRMIPHHPEIDTRKELKNI